MQLIYLSPVPWSSFTQRPHEFVNYFHKMTGGNVLWLEPYPTRLPKWSDIKGHDPNNHSGIRGIPEWLTVLRPYALPIEPLRIFDLYNCLLWRSLIESARGFADRQETVLAVGKPSKLALMLLNSIAVKFSVYDAMDDFPFFYKGISRWSMARTENAIAVRVSQLLASSSRLISKFSSQGRQGDLVRNACRDDLPICGQRMYVSRRHIVGYVGTFGEWFDWDLVVRLAVNRPNYTFRLIGSVFHTSGQNLPSNVDIQPPMDHHNALRAMCDFDVGLIPFKIITLTESVDPIKYYEYRAMGLPVLSTAFGEMLMRDNEDGVYLINGSLTPEVSLDRALEYKNDDHAVIQFRESNTWENRFSEAGLFM